MRNANQPIKIDKISREIQNKMLSNMRNPIPEVQTEQESLQIIESIVRPLPSCNNGTDVDMRSLNRTLDRYSSEYNLILCPDFQRGHIWSRRQQIAYIEAIIRGAVGESGRTIIFNCPDFGGHDKAADSDLNEMLCVDGLQRLTAVSDFIAGKFKIFAENDAGIDLGDGVGPEFFNQSHYKFFNKSFRFQIFTMQYKVDVLDFYIAFNSGGTDHAEEEINRVKAQRKLLLTNKRGA